MMAPPLAVLTGVSLSNLFQAVRNREARRALLLPVALIASAALAFYGLKDYPSIAQWLRPAILVLTGLSIAALATVWHKPLPALRAAAAFIAAASILAAPTLWSAITVGNSSNASLPYAGPSQGGMIGRGGITGTNIMGVNGMDDRSDMFGMGNADDALETYLVSQYVEGTYLVVAHSSSAVDKLIISTGLPAVAYGGFIGSDEGLTLDEFKQLVEEGTITFFLLSGQGNRSGEIESYVLENAQPVSPEEYGGSGRTELYRFP